MQFSYYRYLYQIEKQINMQEKPTIAIGIFSITISSYLNLDYSAWLKRATLLEITVWLYPVKLVLGLNHLTAAAGPALTSAALATGAAGDATADAFGAVLAFLAFLAFFVTLLVGVTAAFFTTATGFTTAGAATGAATTTAVGATAEARSPAYAETVNAETIATIKSLVFIWYFPFG